MKKFPEPESMHDYAAERFRSKVMSSDEQISDFDISDDAFNEQCSKGKHSIDSSVGICHRCGWDSQRGTRDPKQRILLPPGKTHITSMHWVRLEHQRMLGTHHAWHPDDYLRRIGTFMWYWSAMKRVWLIPFRDGHLFASPGMRTLECDAGKAYTFGYRYVKPCECDSMGYI